MYSSLPAHRESPLLVVAPLLCYAPDYKQTKHLLTATTLYKPATAPAERHHQLNDITLPLGILFA